MVLALPGWGMGVAVRVDLLPASTLLELRPPLDAVAATEAVGPDDWAAETAEFVDAEMEPLDWSEVLWSSPDAAAEPFCGTGDTAALSIIEGEFKPETSPVSPHSEGGGGGMGLTDIEATPVKICQANNT